MSWKPPKPTIEMLGGTIVVRGPDKWYMDGRLLGATPGKRTHRAIRRASTPASRLRAQRARRRA